MFDFGLSFSHIMVIVILAVVVIGPKDLPVMLAKLGQGMNKLRRMAREFQGQVDSAMKDSGLDSVRHDIAALATGVSAVMAPMQTALIASATSGAAKPAAPSSIASSTPAETPALYVSTTYGGSLKFVDGLGETRVLGKKLELGKGA
jgi:sec-independent protein translocase protein TatB